MPANPSKWPTFQTETGGEQRFPTATRTGTIVFVSFVLEAIWYTLELWPNRYDGRRAHPTRECVPFFVRMTTHG